MPRITGPRLLIAVLALFYGAFWFWYGGAGRPLASEEVDHYLALLDQRAEKGGSGAGLRARLEDWARKDDGREFLMVNLMDDPADPKAAEAYNAMILPALIKRGGFPVFISRPFATFIQPDGMEEWDQVAIVRYRSLRDLFEMVTAPETKDIQHLKEASVSQTQVFPTHVVFSFVWVRFIAAALFVALGTGLHFALRPFRWYRR
ncbi:MAG: hypothetical protein RH982_08630 [Parvibaculum sp.]